MLRVHHNLILRACLRWLSVLPFLLVGLMAPGTMAQVGENGLEVVLCTPEGPRTVLMDLGQTPSHPQSAEVCDWALIAQDLLAVTDADVTAQPTPRVADRAIARAPLWFDRPDARQHAARAPPSIL